MLAVAKNIVRACFTALDAVRACLIALYTVRACYTALDTVRACLTALDGSNTMTTLNWIVAKTGPVGLRLKGPLEGHPIPP